MSSEEQHIASSLQQKMSSIQDLEREHYFTAEKIRSVSIVIEDLKNE